MNTFLNHALVAVAIVAGPGAAGAQTLFVREDTQAIVTRPLDLAPVQRTTIYRSIEPQGRGRGPIVKERIVSERYAPAPVLRERVLAPAVDASYAYAPAVRERVVTVPVDSAYAYAPAVRERVVTVPVDSAYAYAPAPVVRERVVTVDSAYAYVAPAPIVTERVVTPVVDAYAYVPGPRETLGSGLRYTYEVDSGMTVATCRQRYRSYDPISGTFLGYDGLRHPCP